MSTNETPVGAPLRTISTEQSTSLAEEMDVTIRARGVVGDSETPEEIVNTFEDVQEIVLVMNTRGDDSLLTEEERAEGKGAWVTDLLVSGGLCSCATMIGDALVSLVRRFGWAEYEHISAHIGRQVQEALEEDVARAAAEQGLNIDDLNPDLN